MTNEELHQRFYECGQNIKKWMYECALLLPEIYESGIWRKRRFTCIYEYAAKLANMSRSQVNDALRIGKHLKTMPLLKEVAREKGINRIKPIITLINDKNEAMWAAKARTTSKNELEILARAVRNSNEKPQFKMLTMTLKAEMAEKLQQMNQNNWTELMQKLVEAYESQHAQEKPPTQKTESRSIPAATKKFIKKRSHGKCEAPDCNRKAQEFHHQDPFSINKEHNPDRIVHLCQTHHNLIHKGHIKDQHLSPRHWQITTKATNLSPIDQKIQHHKTLARAP